jgi:hypothetical protein
VKAVASGVAEATTGGEATAPPLLSVVTPARNEAANLGPLAERLLAVVAGLAEPAGGAATLGGWEWIVVDDGSSDGTASWLAAAAAGDPRRRFLRNRTGLGAHPAIRRGFEVARGQVVVVLAGDLQDPPEVIPRLLAGWRRGADVVWAVRTDRRGEPRLQAAAARAYHWLVRRVAGARALPAGCAGCCLLTRPVVERLLAQVPPPTDLFAAVAAMPLRFAEVAYERAPRGHGESRWSLRDRVRFALRSLAGLPPSR